MADFKSLNGYGVKDEVARDLASDNQSRINSLEGDVTNLKDTTSAHDSTITSMQNNMSIINQNITNVNQELDTNNSYMNSVQANVEAMNESFNSITGDIANLKNDNTSNKNKISTLETDNVTIKNDILDLQNDKASAQELAELKGVSLFHLESGAETGTLSEKYTNFDEIRIAVGPADSTHKRIEVMPSSASVICIQHTGANNTSVYLYSAKLTFDGTSFTLSNRKGIQLDGASHSAVDGDTLVYDVIGIKY